MRLLHAKGLCQFSRDILNLNPQPASGDLAPDLELLDHTHGDIDGDRKRKPHETAGAAVNLGVNPNHLALKIKQGPPGIARVDGDIRLDEGDVVVTGKTAALGADDARGGGMIEPEG